MSETAIGAALRKSGLDVDAKQARRIAYDELRRYRERPSRAVASFAQVLRERQEILEQVALFYLEDAARDMIDNVQANATRRVET